MALRTRIVLALIGLLLVLLAVLALGYVAQPRETALDQYQPPVTLFVPPAAEGTRLP